ncbi:Glyoxalase domain-containing protein 5 [Wickerhamomyces ciferrii]|uniref:Glyoxalase domain-containing protein 5 n=1 Tax=Wickerhamomyces ciferrii (strain ATCC 14091 / BCRC 22168 / CBS 111 / JCM 3599 / NBRC 0793 / NRRL Y-1031 F-60-10) TaxID=1206466 RepID=K0KM06_WICCF|nr:Glyoxalase domain-containing protein 5 [Wickerhamomyces ciferrii]CCH44036.1 Glyoxalase domain-containing protein 5 [Wickerhamomyces ciferrii]
MLVKDFDHIVFTVNNIQESIDFYTTNLGFKHLEFKADIDKDVDPLRVRNALVFGNKKINLHQRHKEMDPFAQTPTVGSQDLCFILSDDLTVDQAINQLTYKGIETFGHSNKPGSMGLIESFYIRDPDGNLLEFAKYL